MKWINTDEPPKEFGDINLFREDAGVFCGFYGNIAETISDRFLDKLISEGLTEEESFEVTYWGYDFEQGVFRCDNSEIPTQWQTLPKPPKE